MSVVFFHRLRNLALLVMAASLGAYILAHSPLRSLTVGAQACLLCGGCPGVARLAQSLSALWLVLVASSAAWLVFGRFAGPFYEKLLVGGLCAFALIVVPAATVGEIAERLGAAFLKPPSGPLIASLPSVALVAVGLGRGWRPHRIRLELPPIKGLVSWVALLAATMLLCSVAIGLMHPATGGDALSYHGVLAVYLWQDGNLGTFLDRSPSIWALAHPGMAELWFGLLRMAGGEALANLGQLPFALLGVVAIYAFSRRLGMRQPASMLAGLSWLLVPMVVLQSVMQPNDIVGSALLMASVALASAPISDWRPGRIALLGLGLGLTATTKLALLPCVAGVGLFAVVAILRYGIGHKPVATVRHLSLLALVFLIAVAPWWTRNLVRYQNPIYPSAIPFLGRGVYLGDLGRIDISFVPSPAAWPFYPLIEPYDDRSGFGALFLIGAVPGFVFALQRARRQPLALFVVVTAITLPAWWIYTLHEPRFLLGLVGLSFAFIPWLMMAVARSHRFAVGLVLAVAALFSTLVTFDQALLPFARQPNDRPTFYDRVWAIDPYVTALPEDEAILLNTGYAPTIFEYTAFYPLLGPNQARLVVCVDAEATTALLVDRMKKEGVRYAYVAAAPENQAAVQALYDPAVFELVHESDIVVGEQIAARRVLYRPPTPSEQSQATRRYLFELK